MRNAERSIAASSTPWRWGFRGRSARRMRQHRTQGDLSRVVQASCGERPPVAYIRIMSTVPGGAVDWGAVDWDRIDAVVRPRRVLTPTATIHERAWKETLTRPAPTLLRRASPPSSRSPTTCHRRRQAAPRRAGLPSSRDIHLPTATRATHPATAPLRRRQHEERHVPHRAAATASPPIPAVLLLDWLAERLRRGGRVVVTQRARGARRRAGAALRRGGGRQRHRRAGPAGSWHPTCHRGCPPGRRADRTHDGRGGRAGAVPPARWKLPFLPRRLRCRPRR